MEQNIVRKVLQIQGMTCTGCETRIENLLRKLDGVIEIKAIFSSSNVYVTYNTNIINLDEIVKAIEDIDYQVINKPGNKPEVNIKTEKDDHDKMPVSWIIGAGIIVLSLYVIIKNTIGFNFIPQVDSSMGYGVLFVVGLLTSLHCIAMCGGINLSQCVSYKSSEDEGRASKLKPSLLYNAGRVVAYTVIGGIVGALGGAINFSGAAKGIVAIASGAFMLIMGLNMLNIFPWLRKINPRMPKIFGSKVYGASSKGPFVVGLLNGLMPCGPLQAMQIYALGTGSALSGALSMLMFSLGTVPLMFGFGAISSLLSSKFTHKMMKASAVLVMVLGIIMVGRGLNLSGVNVAFAASSNSGSIAKLQGNVQIVTTKITLGGYSPIVVQKGIPVKWIIKADKADLNGCNSRLTIPKYEIEKALVPGDNLIEFTPKEEGDIKYTCWMGMISSSIKVVTDITKASEQDVTAPLNQPSQSVGGGCCGG